MILRTMTATPFAPDTLVPCMIRPSPNHGDRKGRVVDALVLHYTGMKTADAALARLCDAAAEVSSHYLVDEGGGVFQLVPEARRAWHAGRSFWQGERDLNAVSIGIEIANAGQDGGLPPFPDVQIEAVIALCQDILVRHDIPAARVLAHSDIAPGRKIDPGPQFAWARLAAAGVGVWPSVRPLPNTMFMARGAVGEPVSAMRSMLANVGFDTSGGQEFDEACEIAINALHLRYRSDAPAGLADDCTHAILSALLQTK